MPEKERKFFCGCSTKDSAFSLGVVMVIFSLFSFCGVLKATLIAFHSSSVTIFFGFNTGIIEESPNLIFAFRFALLIMVLLSVVMLGANILLVVGLTKDKALLVKQWKIACLAMTFMYFLVAVSLAIMVFSSECSDTIASFFVVAGFVHACLVLYVVSIVNFQHKVLEGDFQKFTNSEA